MKPGIYVYQYSVCVQIISDALHHRIALFNSSLKQRGITIELFENKARFTVLGGKTTNGHRKTTKIPQKALESWSMLEKWLESRIAALLK